MTQVSDKDQEFLQERSERLPPWVWVAMGLLLVLALVVVFVLPRLVEEYELPFTPRAEQTVIVPGGSTATPLNAISPFDEAQRARQRKEAQDVLAALLQKQEALNELNVTAWADAEYQSAVEAARLGDEAYRTQQFEEARQQYAEADQQLSALQDDIPAVFNRYLEAGQQALADGDAEVAEQSFMIALDLMPESAEAGQGLERALTLEEVMALQNEAEDLREQGDLDAARELLAEAVALDPGHQEAADMLAQVRTAIAEREFTAVMSEGFSLLQNGQSDQAIAAFERALRMRPGSEQAQEAINQTRNELAVQQINQARQQAEQAVAEERWADAVAAYDRALQVDGNLVFASEGRDYAQKRLQLDTLLQQAIAQPERLADNAVYEQVAGIYYAGRDVEAQGPRLQEQLDSLEALLRQAQQPAQVQLVSDNATEITLYQVGNLGKFERQSLTLQPGKYVAVGIRPGYRDVRREFTVGFGHEPGPISIQCQELIAANGS